MYNAQEIADIITYTAKRKKIVLKIMLRDCDLNVNAISNIRNGQKIAAESLARIADFLDVSVDYLLGRTDTPEINRGAASCIVSNSSGAVAGNNNTINGAPVPAAPAGDSMVAEMLEKFNSLQFADKLEIMQAIAGKCSE